MKFGCCGNMITGGCGVDIIEQLKEIGYDYIELSLSHIAQIKQEQFKILKDRIKNTGIKCEVCNNFFPHDLKLTGTNVSCGEIKKYINNSIERASKIGAEVIVFGSGIAKNVPDDFPINKAWEQLINLLRYIDNIANTNDIIIAIEPLRREECNIINTVSEGLSLVRKVNRKNIKLLVDYYHMTYQNEEPKIIIKARDYIQHIHFANVNGRVFPKNILENKEYKKFIKELMNINYNKRVSVEAYSKNFYNDAKKSLEFLRNYFN